MAVRFGVLGDSNFDSFRGTDNRGGPYAAVTFGPLEVLVRLRGFDAGPWDTYTEPRRTDYAYNWARSAATAYSMIHEGQHTGLASQISGGLVDYALVAIGINDFSPTNAVLSILDDIYNGTLTGSDLTAALDLRANCVVTALDTLYNAGALGVICQLFPKHPAEFLASAGWTDPARVQLVHSSVDYVNEIVLDAANSYGFPIVRWEGLWEKVFVTGAYPGRIMDVWGESLNIDGVGNEPHNAILADGHAGTLLNCMQANEMIIKPLNEAYGLSIEPIRAWEMIELIGVQGPRGSLLKVG